jgi:glycerate kinase
MKVLVAPNALRGALSAPRAAQAIAAGLRSTPRPPAAIDLCPVADGGDGTAECMVAAMGGGWRFRRVLGPLGTPVRARYGVAGDTAIIEMAEASGLRRAPRPDPLRASTYGTGELVRDAVEAGFRRIVVGLGGSATNDGGRGFAEALGWRFLDAEGRPLPPGPLSLAHLARVEPGRDLRRVEIIAACDVDNPLTGPTGASAVFGPQKGADAEAVERLDKALARLAEVVAPALATAPGAGAAGGLGFGLMAFAGGRLEPGAEFCLRAVRLRERARGCDLVFTAEGRVDDQTARGKAPLAVGRAGAALGVPVVCLAGAAPGEADLPALYDAGVTAVLPIAPGPISLRGSMARAGDLLADAASRAWRLFTAGRHA